MTYWAPLELQSFARGVGFPMRASKEAATLAMVASEGADHYQFADPGGSGIDQRGLYALPAARAGEGNADRLYDPQWASRLLYDLWDGYGRRWDWTDHHSQDGGWTLTQTLRWLESGSNWRATAKQAYGQGRGTIDRLARLSLDDLAAKGIPVIR